MLEDGAVLCGLTPGAPDFPIKKYLFIFHLNCWQIVSVYKTNLKNTSILGHFTNVFFHKAFIFVDPDLIVMFKLSGHLKQITFKTICKMRMKSKIIKTYGFKIDCSNIYQKMWEKLVFFFPVLLIMSPHFHLVDLWYCSPICCSMPRKESRCCFVSKDIRCTELLIFQDLLALFDLMSDAEAADNEILGSCLYECPVYLFKHITTIG